MDCHHSVFGRRLLLILICALLACSAPGAGQTKPADLVLLNARIYTVDPANPWAEAIAVRAGTIVAVGSNEEVSSLIGPRTTKIDAGGRLVLPGLIDSHIHFLSGSVSLSQLQLDGAGTVAEIQERLRKYAAENPSGWITGRGWLYSTFGARGLPDRKQLDEVVADRPVLLEAYDGHTHWANSAALAAAGITRATPDPPKGEIVRDANGEPTGALKEAAAALMEKLVPPLTKEKKLAALSAGLAEAARLGLTSIVNASGGLEEMALYAELERRGQLTLRTYTAMPLRPEAAEKDFAAFERAARQFRSPWVRGGLVKGFVDGVIETHTAAMLEPYADDSNLRGSLNYEPQGLKRLVMDMDRRGLQVILHAIGDRGVRTALDAFEAAFAANQKTDRRFRIEHIETISAEDIPRFGKLGVIAGYQPYHGCFDEGAAGEESVSVWTRNVGPQRLRHAFAWREVSRAGGTLAFGSDWPVVTLNPFVGIQSALLCQMVPDADSVQSFKVQDAIAGYTIGGAYAQKRESELGSLKVGKLADLVVVTASLFDIPPSQIHTVRSYMTIVGGKIVYRTPE